MTVFVKVDNNINPKISLCFTAIVVEYTVSLENMGLWFASIILKTFSLRCPVQTGIVRSYGILKGDGKSLLPTCFKMRWLFILSWDVEYKQLWLTSVIRLIMPYKSFPWKPPIGTWSKKQNKQTKKNPLETKGCIIWECAIKLKWVALYDNICLVYWIISSGPHAC